MPHTSSTSSTTTTNATKGYHYNNNSRIVSPTLTERFPLAAATTPPPSSASPVELAPILDMCDSVDNRPPSPDSPRLKKSPGGMIHLSHHQLSHHHHHHSHHHHSHFQQQQHQYQQYREEKMLLPPAYLEPTPQFIEPSNSTLFPLNLFSSFSTKTSIIYPTQQQRQQKIPVVALQIPIPRRKSSNNNNTRIIIPPPSSPQSVTTTTTATIEDSPMSPTMAAASASAAAAADHRNPGSHVAKSLLKSISHRQEEQDVVDDSLTYHHSRVPLPLNKKNATTTANNNNNNVDQSMFLTKNAHIKRPRNAWIHFRCHYGQALKAQDPTLRAEEISKRASRRWGKLSENEKRPWHGLAEQEKLAHREAFPEYRYCPRRATSTSVTASNPPSPPSHQVVNRVRSATTSDINTFDVFNTMLNNTAPSSFRPQKRVKRNSK